MPSKFVRILLCLGLMLLSACSWLRPTPPAAEPESTPAEEASLDTIRVKGDTLRGRLVRLTAEHVEFETVYGAGTLSIAYDDIEELFAHGEYVIRYGENYETAKGRLVGYDAGELIVGSAPPAGDALDTPDAVVVPDAEGYEVELGDPDAAIEPGEEAQRVAVADIKRAVREEDFDDSLMTRMRTRYSEWSVDLDFGLVFEEGAIDKQKLNVGTDVERRSSPTRFVFNLDYAFETQQDRTAPETTTKNELVSIGRLEYDLGERLFNTFAFGLMGGEWDKPRGIEWRVFPSAGLGYRIFDSERLLLQLLGGFGYVIQEYGSGIGQDQYAAGLIGGELRWRLPLDAELAYNVFYMPKLTDPGGDWLLRTRFLLTMPIWDPLTFRFRVTEVNDNNPTPDTGNNKFTTTFGIGLRF